MRNESDKLFFGHTYEFLERYLPLQVGRSAETVRSYRDALTVFRRYVSNGLGSSVAAFTFDNCDKDCILGFMESLQAAGASAGTCNQRLAAIKSYLWFASDKDVAIQSVAISASHVPPVKGAERIREKLSEDALATIFTQPDVTRRTGIRDLTIMVLLYDSGIRLAELLGLSIGDVFLDGDEPHVFVVGKGSKERVVAIGERTAEHIRRYLGVFHAAGAKPEDPLFYTCIRGDVGRMSPSNVERFVQKYADKARAVCLEVPQKVYPHMFRRTRATDLYQSGVALELVSRILGHSSTNSTKVYAKPSMAMLREAMGSVTRTESCEEPMWLGSENEMARLCGLR
jgi:site-specific recombinase XerD